MSDQQWMRNLAGMMQNASPEGVKVGVVAVSSGVTGGRTLLVSWDNCDPVQTTWSGGFELYLSSLTDPSTAVGQKVIVLLANGQPIVDDIIIGS